MFKKMGKAVFLSILLFTPLQMLSCKFSECFYIVMPTKKETIDYPEVIFERNKTKPEIVWHKKNIKPFTELIISWNARRPLIGKFSFYVNIKHNNWSGWKKISEWCARGQQSYVLTGNPFVHVKHVRTEVKRGKTGSEYMVKVVAENGADINNVKALFANTSNWNSFKKEKSRKTLLSTLIRNVPIQSQWWIDHHRTKDLCSPTSIGIVSNYLRSSSITDISNFAEKVHDDCYLDIYGNWMFNVAEAYNSSKGKNFYLVRRLNDFSELHAYLLKKTPVAVSIRGNLRGCAWPYNNGHFVVVVGWDNNKKRVICIDPAFRDKKKIVRAYHLNDFLEAWGKSRNLSYVTMSKII